MNEAKMTELTQAEDMAYFRADLCCYSPESYSLEEMRVSCETIYQALYVQGKGQFRDELGVLVSLRGGRKGRKPRSKLPARGGRPWSRAERYPCARPRRPTAPCRATGRAT